MTYLVRLVRFCALFVALLLLVVAAWFLAVWSIMDLMPATIDGRLLSIVEAAGLTFLLLVAISWLFEARARATGDRLG